MAINLLEASHMWGVSSFVGISSACAYPQICAIPFQEKDIWSGYPEPTNGSYALAKRVMMDLGRAYSSQHNLHCVFPVLANLYGPGDHTDIEKAHVVGALVKKISDAERYGTDVQLLGTGEAMRSLVYVKDVCAVINQFATQDLPIGAYNVGHDSGISIKQMAEIIADVVGFKGNILWGDPRDNGAMLKVLDYTKLNDVYPSRLKTPFKEGLTKAVEYIRDV